LTKPVNKPNPVVKSKTTQTSPPPVVKTEPKKTTPPVVKKDSKKVTAPPVAKTEPEKKNNTPAKEIITNSPTAPVVTKAEPVINKALDAVYTKRSSELLKTIEIDNPTFTVDLYDNGEIDGDTVTVFLNGKPVLTHQALTARALNIYLTLDNSKDVNEVSLFAENLGLIPPNTALMVVTDGISRFEVFLSSTYTQNATVRIRKRISRH
jgi:hypothetical protein